MHTPSGSQVEITRWIATLFEHPSLLRMGHGQRADDLNLGLGWLYYALGRIVRPRHAVVIGSYRGFVPLVMGKALQDNLEPGLLTFIDPSLADDFWTDPTRVAGYFQGFGLQNIRHYRMTTQQFVESDPYRALEEIGLVFVDGYHSEAQARFDFEAFERLLAPRGIFMFHDSLIVRPDKVYGTEHAYDMSVKAFLDEIRKRNDLQLFDLPFGASGLTLLQKTDAARARPLHEWIDGPP